MSRIVPLSAAPLRLATLLLGGGLLSGLLLLSRCFSPSLPACAYRCYQNDLGAAQCPGEYECRSDGYCHLRGNSEACSYSQDQGTSFTLPDLASHD
jgi:hypothetical protein